MTNRQRRDWTKWITTGIAILGVFSAALAWAISVDTAAGKVAPIETKVDRIDRFLSRMAGKWGVEYDNQK